MLKRAKKKKIKAISFLSFNHLSFLLSASLCSRWQPRRKWMMSSEAAIFQRTLLLQKRHLGILIWRYFTFYRLWRFRPVETADVCENIFNVLEPESLHVYCCQPQQSVLVQPDVATTYCRPSALVWIFSCAKKNPETKCVFHPSRSEYRVSTSFGLGSTAYWKINRGLGKYLNQCVQQLLQRV